MLAVAFAFQKGATGNTAQDMNAAQSAGLPLLAQLVGARPRLVPSPFLLVIQREMTCS